MPTSVNAYLVNTGDRLVLIDTGAAKLFGPTLGNLLGNLAAAGYKPEQVDAILITHMHGDHVGGLVADGKLAFANATVHADQRDAGFLARRGAARQGAGDDEGLLPRRAAVARPVRQRRPASRRSTARPSCFPGIRAIAAPGHTPGHSIYSVESKGQRLVLWGDLMHVAAVQFPKPAVTISGDVDSQAAAAQRRKAYADAAKGGYLVAASHLPFPGIGRLRAEGRGYVWVPLTYNSVR